MIYLDNAATTAVYPECCEIVRHYSTERYFNPSALYGKAAEASKELKTARENILRHLGGTRSGSLVFTASGTEADNIALLCKSFKKGSKIIISAAEHAAVYNTALYLKQKDYNVVLCPVDRFGAADIDFLEDNVDGGTALVSVLHVNNETGAINDIGRLCDIVKKKNPNCLVHSDGVQAFKKIDVNVSGLAVDFYSISGHKIHAPKGVGALYIKKGVGVNTFIHGGGQEGNIRSATENIPSIMAFSKAADICGLQAIDKGLLLGLEKFLVSNFDVIINTPGECSGNILSAAFAGIRGETLLHALEPYGIIVGTGSACSAKKSGGRISEALKIPEKYAGGILRFSVGRYTARGDIETLQENLTTEINKLLRSRANG